jgi:Ran GTPase-activating protein (RanGAP) involved in mRNA processing and transport
LQDNHVGFAGAASLADALAQPGCCLAHLDLRRNACGAAAGGALARALVQNTSLRCLGLARNQLRDDGARALMAAFACNATLRSIGLADNGVSSDVCAEFEAARLRRDASPPIGARRAAEAWAA